MKMVRNNMLIYGGAAAAAAGLYLLLAKPKSAEQKQVEEVAVQFLLNNPDPPDSIARISSKKFVGKPPNVNQAVWAWGNDTHWYVEVFGIWNGIEYPLTVQISLSMQVVIVWTGTFVVLGI